MKKLGNIISETVHKDRPKNLHKEFQFFGCFLAESLGDTEHYSLYIKLAKENDRKLLEDTLRFITDYPQAKSKGRLFMWKLKQLKEERKAIS